jgi:UTP-glucose-1-phosphate uridylyltransferase
VVKAVPAVAGTGTRFCPSAKTICKYMLPVLDQPVLAYAIGADNAEAQGIGTQQERQ